MTALWYRVKNSMWDSLTTGYYAWVRETNRERREVGQPLLKDNNDTKIHFLKSIGFLD